MSIKQIITNWHSEEELNSRPYLIISQLIKYQNKMLNKNLINLSYLDKAYDNGYYYIDSDKGTIYKINLLIDNVLINPKEDNKNIFEELKCNTYMKLNFYLKTLKRAQFFDKKVTNFIAIHISFNNLSEYFQICDIKMDEISIAKNILIKNNKRKANQIDDNNVKIENKKRKEEIDFTHYISASKVRNSFLDDHLIDWLQEYNITSLEDIPISKKGNSKGLIKYEPRDTFINFIKKQGNEFEEKIMKEIEKNHKVAKVAQSYEAKNVDFYNKTIELMTKGENIIYQAVLHNHNNKTYGAPDLLIRNDYINKFIGYDIYKETFGSPKLNTPWHYVVVDIKHSTINLTSDSIYIRNDGSVKAYKGQLLVYTQALNEVQGTTLTKAFIFGKKYTYESKGIKYELTEIMNKMGTIDYGNYDLWCIKKLEKTLDWIRLIRTEGHNWKLLPFPTKNELLPNMKVDSDGIYYKLKKELADKIYEITSVWNVGYEKRQVAFDKGIFGWNDRKCITSNMGFSKNSSIANKIDKILDINRNKDDNIILRPEKINFDEFIWRQETQNQKLYFLDYETINSNYGKINSGEYKSFNYIFMIGIGFMNKEDKWEYKCFILEKLDKDSERLMFNKFWEFINENLKIYNKTEAVFVHWSPAEKLAYEKAQLRHLNLQDKNLIDLYKIFINEPIVVKGALKFSLKTIINAFNSHNLTNLKYDNSLKCVDGLNAMHLAYQCYQKNNIVSDEINEINDIKKYNEVDCKSLMEILFYIRKNH